MPRPGEDDLSLGILKGSMVKALERRLVGAESGPLLEKIGAMMKNRARKAFAEQGREGSGSLLENEAAGEWPERKVPNIMGILSDFNRGKAVPPARRFQPRPAAIDEGMLKRSIDYRLVGSDTVQCGTSVPYARKIQRGGESKAKVTKEAKTALAAFLRKGRTDLRDKVNAKLFDYNWRTREKKKAKKGPWWQNRTAYIERNSLRNQLGWLFQRDHVSQTIPPRPFLMITLEDREDFKRTIVRFLVKPLTMPRTESKGEES